MYYRSLQHCQESLLFGNCADVYRLVVYGTQFVAFDFAVCVLADNDDFDETHGGKMAFGVVWTRVCSVLQEGQ